MLLQFFVKNYRSIGDELLIDLTAAPGITTHTNYVHDENGIKILPLCAMFGSNASGKSTVIKAFFDFWRNIRFSYTNGIDDALLCTPFLFNRELAVKPTTFEIVFVFNGTEYQYGHTITRNKVIEEWLYSKKASRNKTKEKMLFERTESGIVYNEARQFECLNQFNDVVNDNVLLLSFLGQKEIKGIDVFNDVMKFFSLYSTLDMAGATEDAITDLILKIYNLNTKLKNECVQFIKEFDPTFEDIEIVVEKNSDGERTYRAFTIHNGEKFPLDIESAGTKKLIKTYLYLGLILQKGGIFVVDELDCQLHPLVLRRIVSMFHDKEINKAHAQLIFNSHNIIILNKQDLRRDEIYFIEKNQEGMTSASCLAEFETNKGKARSDLDFGKNYLAGRFGAIPYQNKG